MRRPGRRARLARLPIAAALATIALVAPVWSGATPHVDALSAWTGGVDLYRSGAFSTQQSWLWCTAADVQIMRNLVDHETDHSRANQSRYFTYMRAHDRYAMPVSDGTEPSGWATGLRRYVDSRYRVVQSTSFNAALRSAVTSLRKTSRPVGLLVARGDHAWVLTGFTATADPARTSHFTVTSVRVTGPLWGLQSTSYGYDMRPDTRLTPSQLRGFFSPWHYARIRMAWEGRWVSIQAIPRSASSAGTSNGARATPKPAATPRPKAIATAPTVSPSPSLPVPSLIAPMSAELTPAPPVAAAVAPAVGPSTQPAVAPSATSASGDIGPGVGLLLAAAVLVVLVAAGFRVVRGRSRGTTILG